MGPTTKDQSNQVSPLTEDITNFLRGTFADSLGQASSLQRILSGGVQQALPQFFQPFDTGPQIAALKETHAQDRTDLTNRVKEQFGIAGNRQGTPIAVGTARGLGDLIPQQEAQIGDLLLRAFATQGQVIPGILGAGTGLANSIQNPLLQFAGRGAVNPAVGPSPFTQVTGGIGDLFG